jgi:hypothetical protein
VNFAQNFTWNHPVEYPFTPGIRQRLTTAIACITRDTLHKVWDELDYRLDICRVTRGAHIESARCVQNFNSFSIDLFRCEVLSSPHLFSVWFLKCKVLLCSACINDLYLVYLQRNSVVLLHCIFLWLLYMSYSHPSHLDLKLHLLLDVHIRTCLACYILILLSVEYNIGLIYMQVVLYFINVLRSGSL